MEKPIALDITIEQVPHHGYSGGSTEFFKAVDPQILLWPIPEYRYLEITELAHNRFFKYISKRIANIAPITVYSDDYTFDAMICNVLQFFNKEKEIKL